MTSAVTKPWSKATLVENHVLSPGLHRVTLEVPRAISKAFHTAGQYHRVRMSSGADAFFAMASAPGESRFDYLVKATGEVASAWVALPRGAHVEVSLPEGPGFPLEQARGSPLLLVGTGTGFGPLWSVIRAIRPRRREFESVRALYGVDVEAQLAWRDEWPALEKEGIELHPVLDKAHPGWKGRAGRVQAHVEPLALRGQFAFLCGHPAMVSEVSEILGRRGVPPERVFLNVPTL